MRSYMTIVFTGTIDESGTFKGEGTSYVRHEMISSAPKNATAVRVTTAPSGLSHPITVVGKVSGNSLEGQILWDGETRFKFDGFRP